MEKTNNDLQEGIENIRERPIIYRVGELLASGVIKKTDDPVKIQNDLNQIIALANSKIIDFYFAKQLVLVLEVQPLVEQFLNPLEFLLNPF